MNWELIILISGYVSLLTSGLISFFNQLKLKRYEINHGILEYYYKEIFAVYKIMVDNRNIYPSSKKNNTLLDIVEDSNLTFDKIYNEFVKIEHHFSETSIATISSFHSKRNLRYNEVIHKIFDYNSQTTSITNAELEQLRVLNIEFINVILIQTSILLKDLKDEIKHL